MIPVTSSNRSINTLPEHEGLGRISRAETVAAKASIDRRAGAAEQGGALSRTVEGTAADGHRLSMYRADPAGAPRGALVVAQEIFGVNSHIRAVCDDYAAQGYVADAGAVRPGRARHRARLRPDDITRGRAIREGCRSRMRSPTSRRRPRRSRAPGRSASSATAGAARSPGSPPRARAPSQPRSATMAAACRTSRTSSRTARCSSISASRTTPSRSRAWRSCRPRIRTSRCTSTRPGTGSTATSAPPTTPRAPAWRASARSRSCAQHIG